MSECAQCGVTTSDLPYEEMGLGPDDADEALFEQVDGQTMCQGCGAAAAARNAIQDYYQ